MKRFFLLAIFITSVAYGQVIGPVDSPFNAIRQNGVSSMAAFGDTLWISPSLDRYIVGTGEWFSPESADSVIEGKGRVYSLALGQDTVVSGLGYTSTGTAAGAVPAGLGYYFSTDGGDSWRFSDFLLDPKAADNCEGSEAGCDTTFTYGGQTYNRARVTVREQSPPYSIDFEGNVVFSANWASGLLRSVDFGESWQRVVLPPSGVDLLTPERNDYFWFTCIETDSGGDCSESVNLYNSVPDDNLKGFGVFIDSDNNVWFGSANGVNISSNALYAPIDSISWKNINFDNSEDGLLSDWIIEIDQDPNTGKIWMTNWIAEGEGTLFYQMDNFGIVSTGDGGDTFEQHLIGERINDIGFKDGFVYAAGDNGLFISPDGGDTWIEEPQIKTPNTFIRPSATYYSVASTTERIWIGTDDGIASSTDNGETWSITRTDFPLKGGNVHDPDAPDVDTYAYPNPFSPSVYDVVRIKFEVPESGNVRVRIFDLGMNLVRELENSSFSSGTYEAAWDGYDSKGRKVANGPYIYIIETGGEKVNGKILVAD